MIINKVGPRHITQWLLFIWSSSLGAGGRGEVAGEGKKYQNLKTSSTIDRQTELICMRMIICINLDNMKGLRLPQSLVNTNTPALGFKKMDDSINPDAPQT